MVTHTYTYTYTYVYIRKDISYHDGYENITRGKEGIRVSGKSTSFLLLIGSLLLVIGVIVGIIVEKNEKQLELISPTRTTECGL